eukprot:c24818_g1_i2 orf=22-1227(-)
MAASVTKASPIRESTKSPSEGKTDNAVDINIEKVDNLQALHIDNTSTGIKRLYFGRSFSQWALLTIASLMLLVGTCAGTLVGRLYFVHGGSRRWLYTWLQSAGWPINLIPLCISYAYKKRSSGGHGDRIFQPRICTLTNLKLFSIYVAMGFLVVVDNLVFAWGLSYLPASTSALLLSSQLAFNAVFSYLLVGQRITPSVINSVFAMTIGAVLLGVHASADRPPETTKTEYIMGFILTIAAAALYALIITLLEVIYKSVLKTRVNYVVAMEVQTMISAAAAAMSMVGMWAAGDFHFMIKESESFDLGRGGYALTLIGSAVSWELFLLGAAGVVFLGSSLFSCVLVMAALPMVSFLSFVFFRDSFSALKAISMLISMWGIISYIYGGYSASKARKPSSSPQSG